jgi:hypothetical protein
LLFLSAVHLEVDAVFVMNLTALASGALALSSTISIKKPTSRSDPACGAVGWVE